MQLRRVILGCCMMKMTCRGSLSAGDEFSLAGDRLGPSPRAAHATGAGDPQPVARRARHSPNAAVYWAERIDDPHSPLSDQGEARAAPRRRRPLWPPLSMAANDPNRVAPRTTREQDENSGVGTTLLGSTRLLRVKEVDLEEQRTGDRKVDRDHGLEVVNRNVQGPRKYRQALNPGASPSSTGACLRSSSLEKLGLVRDGGEAVKLREEGWHRGSCPGQGREVELDYRSMAHSRGLPGRRPRSRPC
jgi:hypothetical protein